MAEWLSTVAAFAAACFLLALAPGPSVAIVMRETLRGGRRSGAAAALGTETGIVGWAVAAALGLSALVAVSEVAYDTIRYVGVAVLVGLGAQALWSARRPSGPGEEGPGPGPAGPRRSAATSYRAGLVTIAANPKGAVFSSSFLPQFVPADAPFLPTMLALGLLWAVVDGTWLVVVAHTVSGARHVFTRARVRQRLEQLTGVVLLGLGARLATESR